MCKLRLARRIHICRPACVKQMHWSAGGCCIDAVSFNVTTGVRAADTEH